MREHAMHPPCRRRFVATTDSGHDEPIFPDRSRDREVDGPNRLWVADLTYIAIPGGFVYLAAIMDAWSRRIVGYGIGRRIDARLTLAALATAIEGRNPPVGCIHHSDRGSQGGFNRSSQHVQFDWPASTGPELRREFSIRGSCGAVY